MSNFFQALLMLLFGLMVIGTESNIVEPVPVAESAPIVRGVTSPVAVQATSDAPNPMLRLLAFAPDTPETRKWLTLGDMGAWYDASEVTPIEDVNDLQGRPEAERTKWIRNSRMHTYPPAALGSEYLMSVDMHSTHGFDYLDARQFMEAASPPNVLTAVTLAVARETIAAALLANDYTLSPVAGGVLYSKRGDFEIDLMDPSPLGRLGMLNRVAILETGEADGGETTLLIARGSEPIEQALDAAAHSARSLAGDPYYAAVAAELENLGSDLKGSLVGALFLGEMPVMDVLPSLGSSANIEDATERIAEMQAWYDMNPLALWPVAALATYVDEDGVWLKVAVAFAPGVDAASNAFALEQRLSTYRDLMQFDPGDELWSHAATSIAEVNGVPVISVVMRLDPDAVDRIGWIPLLVREGTPFLVPTAGE